MERECPNGWKDCEVCLYKHPCKLGLYEPEEDEVNIQEIADKIEKQDKEQVKKDAEVIKLKNEHEDFWQWWGRTSPPDSLKQREPVNAMSGAIERGGGSKSGKKKKLKKPSDWRPYMII